MNIRYVPHTSRFFSQIDAEFVGFLSRAAHERDPSLGHAMAAGPDLLEAAKQLDRLSLLIEHAVSYSAASPDYDAVVAAIKDLRAAIKKATGATP